MNPHQSPPKTSLRDKQSLFSEPPAPFWLHPFPSASESVSRDRSYVTRPFVLVKGASGAVQLTEKAFFVPPSSSSSDLSAHKITYMPGLIPMGPVL